MAAEPQLQNGNVISRRAFYICLARTLVFFHGNRGKRVLTETVAKAEIEKTATPPMNMRYDGVSNKSRPDGGEKNRKRRMATAIANIAFSTAFLSWLHGAIAVQTYGERGARSERETCR